VARNPSHDRAVGRSRAARRAASASLPPCSPTAPAGRHRRPVPARRAPAAWPGGGLVGEDPDRAARADELRRLHAPPSLAQRPPGARPARWQPPVPARRGVLAAQRRGLAGGGVWRRQAAAPGLSARPTRLRRL